LLYLVRHADVVLEEGTPAREWQLSETGRADAARLASARIWGELSLVATSPEPKARETARPLAGTAGVELRQQADLREVERGCFPIVSRDEYEARVGRYFSSEPEDWEPQEQATARIASCIGGLAAESGGPLGVVSHGLLLSLYVASLEERRPAVEEWRRVALPAIAVVDLERGCVVSPFLDVDSFLARHG
jgi:broad specificity phosphatase PhoE